MSLFTREVPYLIATILMPGNATESDLKDLLNELQVMESAGNHPNIVNLIGACMDGGTYVA